jgi:hypothetical protein
VGTAAALCGAVVCYAAFAQNKTSIGKSWEVPPAVNAQPFATDSGRSHAVRTIEFIQQNRMSQQDKLIAANAESSVTERAHWGGFSLEDGSWNYQQVVCPSFPGHLFLRYTRNLGARDLTVFSASIPRDGGRVRIIPILKRSYSLFSPAPINALTISAFNHIRAEEHGRDRMDWLEDGLCYAALAGANPMAASPYTQPKLGRPVPAVTAVLATEEKGGEVMRFVDAAGKPKPMEWKLTFDRNGRLVKVTHLPAPMRAIHAVPARSAAAKTWTVPGAAHN